MRRFRIGIQDLLNCSIRSFGGRRADPTMPRRRLSAVARADPGCGVARAGSDRSVSGGRIESAMAGADWAGMGESFSGAGARLSARCGIEKSESEGAGALLR